MSFIEYFLERKPHELSVDDISRFIDQRIEENKNLDYKHISLISDFDKMARHVSAFANTEGGLLILGVDEEKQMNRGRKQRIFPTKITWSNHGVSREQIEDNLKARLDPTVTVRIVPIRKPNADTEVIFLLDIPKSNDLHMIKGGGCFYKRLNFESVPMGRGEIIDFIKFRLDYERCAWFRYHLDDALNDYMDGMLIQLNPAYSAIRPSEPRGIQKEFEDLIRRPFDEVFNVVKQAQILSILQFETEMMTVEANVDRINEYPHQEIAPEEMVLFNELRTSLAGLVSMRLRETIWSLARFNKIDDYISRSYGAFAEATQDREHALLYFRNYVGQTVQFSELVLKLIIMLNELQKNFGRFRSCKSVSVMYE